MFKDRELRYPNILAIHNTYVAWRDAQSDYHNVHQQTEHDYTQAKVRLLMYFCQVKGSVLPEVITLSPESVFRPREMTIQEARVVKEEPAKAAVSGESSASALRQDGINGARKKTGARPVIEIRKLDGSSNTVWVTSDLEKIVAAFNLLSKTKPGEFDQLRAEFESLASEYARFKVDLKGRSGPRIKSRLANLRNAVIEELGDFYFPEWIADVNSRSVEPGRECRYYYNIREHELYVVPSAPVIGRIGRFLQKVSGRKQPISVPNFSRAGKLPVEAWCSANFVGEKLVEPFRK
ncbi:hypothetical protein HY214_04445 [Candidatus Roizmanbacteria bacterium]|nr:hypothetical protein [Candidatus Roizmanbacteria bacterium]